MGGKIAELAPDLAGKEQLSASGMLVIPGAVDPHVHIQMPVGPISTSDTWESGTRAAAFGGTTTVIDFVEPSYPGQPLLDAFAERFTQAQGRSAVDFAFHMTLCSADDITLRQVPDVIEAGMSSFKLYTTYPGFHLADPDLLATFQAVARAGGVALVHCESDAILQNATRRLQQAGRLRLVDFPASRPAIAEKEAVDRVLSLADFAQVPVYIVHVSTASAAEAISRARLAGQQAWGETCPQYLLLDDRLIKTADFNGAKFTCCPPIRTPNDNQALWDALAEGGLLTVGTDHCPFNYVGQKDRGLNSFMDIPTGLPGIELRLALLYTYGVKRGKLSLEQWVDCCCTAPARFFRLHPQKGDLVPGADADIVIFAPDHPSTITHSVLHEEVDYTPYEGMPLDGMVRTTILRGQPLVHEGKWIGDQVIGRFLRC